MVALTNRHHLRRAAEYDLPIRCHGAGLHQFEGAEFNFQSFACGDELAPGVRALEVGVLCPDETALHIAAGDGFLAFADAIVRDDDGNLAFVPDHLLGHDPKHLKAGLRDAFARLLDATGPRRAAAGPWRSHAKRRARRTRALREGMSTGVPTGKR